jgi:hypothetical protein
LHVLSPQSCLRPQRHPQRARHGWSTCSTQPRSPPSATVHRTRGTPTEQLPHAGGARWRCSGGWQRRFPAQREGVLHLCRRPRFRGGRGVVQRH